MTNSDYLKTVGIFTDKSPIAKDCFSAFLFGGSVCCFGQVLRRLFESLNLSEENAKLAVSVTLIALTALLTAVGVYDKIGKVAGAGLFVPITGFANSVVSPAIEFNAEGRILGTGAKMFNLAGPVIVYGTAASSLYGLILVLFKLY